MDGKVIDFLSWFQYDRCVWTQCLDPGNVDNMYNDWDGLPVDFGDTIKYTCDSGHFFEDDRHKQMVKAKCMPNGLFDMSNIVPCVRGMRSVSDLFLKISTTWLFFFFPFQ